MSINQRQFEQLTEMGISLWQNKTIALTHNKSSNNNEKQIEKYIEQNEISLSNLTKQTIFNDILHCLGLSIGEITHKKDHLDLGLFNWYFSTTNNEIPIHCNDNNLFSPSLKMISRSPELKRQLWQIIIKHLL